MKTDFQNGERLFAEDLNTNFVETDNRLTATETVANGAIPKPSSPSDNQVLTYDSGTSSWVAETPGQVGKILQVVTALNSTSTSLSGSFQDIGISVSITPLSASSTLVVEWVGTLGAGQNTNGTAAAYSRIVDESNVLVPGSASQVSGYDGENDNAVSGTVLSRGIVSAASTSARTYKAQARHSAYNGGATNCSMVVWEIAG